jgi:Mg-chelatase subunit ChlD
MTNKALITTRGVGRPAGSMVRESATAQSMGMAVEADTPNGTLVSGSDEQYRALEAQGFRVKLLTDTNLLRIGRFTIDTEAAEPAVPASLDVPTSLGMAADATPDWPHHLVQLAGPPTDEWVREIEAQGVDVVEPISGYGLFVNATSAAVEGLRALPFVTWTGPLKPAYRMLPSTDAETHYLFVGVYPSSEGAAVRQAIEAAGGRILDEGTQPATYGGEFATLKVQGVAMERVAVIPHVRWVEAVPRMQPVGERESQIVAENVDAVAPPNTGPVTGYQAWLAGLGADGTGVTVAIVDSGVDANANNNNPVAHTDLRGRQVAFVDYSGGAGATDTNGHGTNVAGIALGSGATGQTEAAAPANFLWGQGVAPGAGFVTQNFLDANVAPQPTVQTLIRDSALNLAQVMNNSWGVNDSGGSGYVANSRVIDLGVRDPNSMTATLEHLAIVCAAGNAGGRPQSIGSPHETKNDIVVGNSLTARPGLGFPSDDIRGISGTSARGPAVDGRLLPTITAPGTNVSAAFSRTALAPTVPIAGTGVPDPMNPGQFIDQYTFMSGTSQACPHVAGGCAVLTQWWRNRTGGKNPSPAMLKALVVNGAEDLAGGANWRCLNRVAVDKATWVLQAGSVFRRAMIFAPSAVVDGNTTLVQVANAAAIVAAGQWAFDAATNVLFVRMLGSTNPGAPGVPFITALDSTPLANVPNNDQGWGRLSLSNIMLQSPASDRGPRIFSDQKHAFTAAGQEFQINVAPVDVARPLRVTLTWTDAAGAAGANPALVNDLDLEVTEVGSGTVFKGNVFNNGFSVAGGAFDNRNTVECVFVQNPAGTYEVRVIAAVIAASATPTIATPWQDFALVIENADVPAAALPVNVAAVIDRSGSMIAYGYVDITRTASKQFVDLMNVGDDVGVSSFGSTADVEFPVAGGPVQDITGQPVKDAAKTEIDGIAFGGCTFMGAGIEAGSNQLAASAAPRALVLLSDGYDNKGCDPGNPAKPSALQAATALPADVRLFSCAMGPASDQALLESLAAATDGRYYFMPTIDDLFEIYNYIRGQVSGDSIAVNQSAMASNSVMPAFVDATAELATFTVAWADTKIRAVPGEPRKPNEVSIRLRDPAGNLLPSAASFVRRQVGDGYVIFRIEEPAAGQWRIEVSTTERTHLRYTAGVFLRSPLRLVLARHPRRVRAGQAIRLAAVMLDGKKPFANVPASAVISAPSLSLAGLIKKHRRALDGIDPPKLKGGDSLPKDIARLMVLQDRLRNEGDLFARKATSQRLARDTTFPLAGAVLSRPDVRLDPGTPVLATTFSGTSQAGSYNFAVSVSGTAPGSGVRFVRKELASVLVQ